MNLKKRIIVTLVMLVLFSSCAKEEQPTPLPSKSLKEQLEEKPWIIVQFYSQEYRNGQKNGPPEERNNGMLIFNKQSEEVEIFVQNWYEVFYDSYTITQNSKLFFGLSELDVIKVDDNNLEFRYFTPESVIFNNTYKFEIYYRCIK